MTLGTITVVNKRNRGYHANDIYIGRPTPMGNSFTHLKSDTTAKYRVPTREHSITEYEHWVKGSLDPNAQYTREWIRLQATRLELGEHIVLVCWCAPLPCHGDVLKRLIEEKAQLRTTGI